MNENERFFAERQQAVERMRQYSRRSRDYGIPAPPFTAPRENGDRKSDRPPEKRPPLFAPQNTKNRGGAAGFLSRLLPGAELPFFQGESDGDITLLLALALLLFNDGCDKMLLYALLYILL